MARGVGVILKSIPAEPVRTWLDGFTYLGDGEDHWVYPPGQDDIVLHIHLSTDFETEWEPEDYDEMVSTFGQEPSVVLFVGISGRFKADDEVRVFITSVLSQFDGLAWDEYVKHWWTLDEIVNDAIIDGFHYFDYLAAYKRNHPDSP